MHEDDAQVDEFMSELYDKFYPQVMHGVELMDAGQLGEGIETLARPLHTIKGVTGFMSGFESASHFTHKVESYLKKLQSGAVKNEPDNVSAAVRAVNMVFQVIEQIKDMGAADEAETTEILEMLDALSAGKAEAGPAADAGVSSESRNGVTVIRVGLSRVHLPAHRAPIEEMLAKLDEGSTVLLDLEHVTTFNSASWEALEPFAAKLHVAVAGMGPACKDVFYFWGFDQGFAVYPSAEAFWKRRECA